MSDVINERVDSAMAEIEVRAQKLKKIKEMARAKNMLKDPGISDGIAIADKMISGQQKLIDQVVFEAPKTRLEQLRNLSLMTGNPNQSVKTGIKKFKDAIDEMLGMLETMVKTR